MINWVSSGATETTARRSGFGFVFPESGINGKMRMKREEWG